jgi:hypothetical protein
MVQITQPAGIHTEAGHQGRVWGGVGMGVIGPGYPLVRPFEGVTFLW